MKTRTTLLIGLSLIFAATAHAQQAIPKPTERDYARKPLWIAMMDDTTTNYYEIEKAFNLYFAHHEQPEGEEEEINEHREREKIPSKRKQRKLSAENKIRMQVKHYYRWREDMLPYVQDDGRILYPHERLAIWKAQQNRR